MTFAKRLFSATAREVGGSGSGNFGHSGRTGLVGGSGPGFTPGATRHDDLTQIALIHAAAQHAPNEPATKAAYNALKSQVMSQYKDIQARGIKFDYSKQDPYTSSKAMSDDVKNNHHLSVYDTPTGVANHPLDAMSPVGKSYNTIFRGVHDVLGHADPGNQFGPKGELAAFQAHAKMFTDAALPALASETLAQNAWVNYGPHNPQSLAAKDRPFAEQKAYAFPIGVARYMKDRPIIKESVVLKPSGAKAPIDDEVDYRRPLHERNTISEKAKKK